MMLLVSEQAKLFYGENRSEHWFPGWMGSRKVFRGVDRIPSLIRICMPQVYAFARADPWVASGLVRFILNKTRDLQLCLVRPDVLRCLRSECADGHWLWTTPKVTQTERRDREMVTPGTHQIWKEIQPVSVHYTTLSTLICLEIFTIKY